MAWSNLAEDVAESFRILEGCVETRPALRSREFLIWDPEKELDAKRDYMRVYSKTPAGKAAIARRDEKRRAKSKPRVKSTLSKIQQQKLTRLKKRIAQWKPEAKLICLGRDIPTEKWVEVMLNPVSAEECEAFTDFVYFLRHRKIHTGLIASMLNCSKLEVETALGYRK